MTRIAGHRAGTFRLANPYMVAMLAVAAQSTLAIAQTPRRITVRATSDTVLRADSGRATGPWLMLPVRKIDSLVRLQDTMTIGSPEYVGVNNELRTLIQASMPRDLTFIKTDTSFSIIQLAPTAAAQGGRAAFATPRIARKMNVEPRGWLGIKTDGLVTDPWREADGIYIRYFVYPVVVDIQPNSPAAKAVQFGDSLLAYNGLDLRSNNINLTRMLEPGRQLMVRLRRDGETKDVAIIPERIPPDVAREREATAVARMLVASATPMMSDDSADRRFVEKAAAAGGRGFGITRASRAPMATMMVMTGLLGARMADLDSSAVLSLTREKASHGVLTTEVPAGSVAARVGLRGGDIIVAVDDTDIISLAQLHRELMARSSNRSTQLVVVREGKVEKLTYEPR